MICFEMNRSIHKDAADKTTDFLHVRQLGPLKRKIIQFLVLHNNTSIDAEVNN